MPASRAAVTRAFLGVAGDHDDRHERIGVGARLADHLGQFEAVEDRHRPVGQHDVRHVMGEGVEAGRAVLGLVDVARAEAVQQRAHDAPHVRIVVDDEETQAIEIDANHGASKDRGNAGQGSGSPGPPPRNLWVRR